MTNLELLVPSCPYFHGAMATIVPIEVVVGKQQIIKRVCRFLKHYSVGLSALPVYKKGCVFLGWIYFACCAPLGHKKHNSTNWTVGVISIGVRTHNFTTKMTLDFTRKYDHPYWRARYFAMDNVIITRESTIYFSTIILSGKMDGWMEGEKYEWLTELSQTFQE